MAEGWEVDNVADEDGVEEASLAREACGIADEGEKIEVLIERMVLEDRDYVALSEDEGLDDEDGGGTTGGSIRVEHIPIRQPRRG